jgi:hypothetical protein
MCILEECQNLTLFKQFYAQGIRINALSVRCLINCLEQGWAVCIAE